MQVLIGLEPEVILCGSEEIENYLYKNHFILDKTHYSNTAFAKQTMDFLKETVKPNLDRLFWSPIVKFISCYSP